MVLPFERINSDIFIPENLIEGSQINSNQPKVFTGNYLAKRETQLVAVIIHC